MPLRIEDRISPVRYRNRDTLRVVHAMRVQDVTMQAVCAWTGGHTWARSVVVPIPDGEQAAAVGDWVVTDDGKTFSVWSDADFRATHGAVTG